MELTCIAAVDMTYTVLSVVISQLSTEMPHGHHKTWKEYKCDYFEYKLL